jgi:hypothetical protein
MSSFEITMPVEGLRLIGDRTPLQVRLAAIELTRSAGHHALVYLICTNS